MTRGILAAPAEALTAPFRRGGRSDRTLVALFAAIHAIALYNALFHDPTVGYDAFSHRDYMEALAELRLPTPEDSDEFFSPPLAYLAPALARRLGLGSVAAMKTGQILNVVWSGVLAFYLLKLCEALLPGSAPLKRLTLGLLGILTVHYKSFAQMRGEPPLAALAVIVAHEAIAAFTGPAPPWRRAVRLGAGIGLACLARQWGFLLIPAVVGLSALQARAGRGRRASCLGAAALSLLVAAPVAGWFYVHLLREHGTVAAFNRTGAKVLAFSNQPAEFYSGLGLDRLFIDPVRDAFPNRLIPVLYSETWGDYWCYFSVYGRDARSGKHLSGLDLDRLLSERPRPAWLETNRWTIARYLGRVNLAALPLTAVLAAGALLGALRLGRAAARPGAGSGDAAAGFLFLAVACTMAGYLWFLLAYPSPLKGRTIKATYVLQAFPLLCALGGLALVELQRRAAAVHRIVLALLAACALHNLPILFTRSTPW